MVKARYVGSAPAMIYNTSYVFSTYGQSVGMSEEMFKAARAGRIHLLTEEQFQSLGHSPEEVAKYSRFDSHGRADAAFQGRLQRAWKMCQEDPAHGGGEGVQVESTQAVAIIEHNEVDNA